MLNNHLDIGPSNALVRVLVVTHLGAIIAVCLANIPWYLVFPFAILSLCSFVYSSFNYALGITGKAILRIKQNEDGTWLLKTGNGNCFDATLYGDSLKTTFLIILNFKVAERWSVIPVVICKDAVSETAFRRLQVQLWVQGAKPIHSL